MLGKCVLTGVWRVAGLAALVGAGGLPALGDFPCTQSGSTYHCTIPNSTLQVDIQDTTSQMSQDLIQTLLNTLARYPVNHLQTVRQVVIQASSSSISEYVNISGGALEMSIITGFHEAHIPTTFDNLVSLVLGEYIYSFGLTASQLTEYNAITDGSSVCGDPIVFPQRYISWANTTTAALSNGIFSSVGFSNPPCLTTVLFIAGMFADPASQKITTYSQGQNPPAVIDYILTNDAVIIGPFGDQSMFRFAFRNKEM
jgi:hypothetical protein